MDSPLHLTLLIITGILRVNGDACVYKECVCSESEIRCSYLDLTSLPALRGALPGTWRLILDNNDITTIQSKSLPPNLLAISMMNNPITTIATDALDGSTRTLNEVSFSNAGFTRFPDAFGRLTALASLTIFDTNIDDWNDEAMKNISSALMSVTLENVGLTTWPTWIKYFTNLTDLSIAGSSMSFIPDDALDMLADTLTTLSLTNTNLRAMPKTFSNLKNLENLQLQNNKISNVSWIPRSSRLSALSLSGNKLSDAKHLSDSLRILEHSLNDLKLDQNQLSSIPDLSYLTKVDNLDFTRNQISDSISGALPTAMNSLDLRFNNLPAIPVIFTSLPIIKDLLLSSNYITEIRASQIPLWTLEADLEYNLITEVTDTSFPENSSLSSLKLINNPITKISNFAFKNLPHLAILELQGTQLTRMPLAIDSLVSLTYLNVFNCQNLICTCQEKSVATIILKSGFSVSGECGETSVYDFYHRFSQECP